MINAVGIANGVDTASGSPAIITNASYEEVEKLYFTLYPIQTGSGDPSPTNVRSFQQLVSSVVIYRTGKNIVNINTLQKTYGIEINSSGSLVSNNLCATCLSYVEVMRNKDYTIQLYKEYDYLADITVAFYNSSKGFISASKLTNGDSTVGRKAATFTTPDNCFYIRFSFPRYFDNFQIEFGNVASPYVKYNGQSGAAFVGLNVYSGTLVDSTDNYYLFKRNVHYSSYNGETLVGPWVSSMDIYQEGTTPTVGAEVIDLGSYETGGQRIALPYIRTKLGYNNIWVSNGEIDVTYHVFEWLNDVANIVYTEQVNTESKITPGAVCAGCLQFDLFNDSGETVDKNDILEYYQINEETNESILMGLFTAVTIEQRRAKQIVIAYDNIIKLDVDFSRKLAQLQTSFPIAASSLAYAVCDVAGIQFRYDAVQEVLPLTGITINKFYADKITCRQVISWLAELGCCFVRCNTQGEIILDWFSENNDYRIYPTSGSYGDETYVFYKMNGLVYDKEISAAIVYVKINITNDPNNDYYYPISSSQNYATDLSGNGDLELFNMTATQYGIQDGYIRLGNPLLYTFDSSGEGDLSVLEEEQSVPNYIISNNLLLTDADESVLEIVAKNIYDRLNDFPTFRNTQVDLFRFNNPFKVGEIVNVTDVLGVSFVFPIVKMEYTSGGDRLSTDDLHYDYN